MRASVFLHTCVTNGVVLEFESLDQLREVAGQFFGITVGVIFNDCGAPVQDVRLIQPSSTLYVDEAGVADFRRGSQANDLRQTNIRQQRERLEDLLGKFMSISDPSSDRDRIEKSVRRFLLYMDNQFGLYPLVSGVEGTDVKEACLDHSKLSIESKQLVHDMMSLLSDYNAVSDGSFKDEVSGWTRNVRQKHGDSDGVASKMK